MSDLPLILVEVVLVFGGAVLFGWWQLRDLARERRAREARELRARDTPAQTQTPAPDRSASRSVTSAQRGDN
jgi:hypothetical protein